MRHANNEKLELSEKSEYSTKLITPEGNKIIAQILVSVTGFNVITLNMFVCLLVFMAYQPV